MTVNRIFREHEGFSSAHAHALFLVFFFSG